MSKKHYVAIAKVFRSQQEASLVNYQPLAKELAVVFAKDNPLFNTEKFLLACGSDIVERGNY